MYTLSPYIFMSNNSEMTVSQPALVGGLNLSMSAVYFSVLKNYGYELSGDSGPPFDGDGCKSGFHESVSQQTEVHWALITTSHSVRWGSFPRNNSGTVWVIPGSKCWGDGGEYSWSKWGTFGFAATWPAPEHQHTHTHTIMLFHLHVWHWAPSGYARSGKTSRAKFRKQLREPVDRIPVPFGIHVCFSESLTR